MGRSRPRIAESAGMSPGAAAAFAELATQVATLEGDYTDLKQTIVGLDRKFTETLTSVATRFETALASVNAKLDERGRTQWPTLISAGGFLLAIMVAIGTLAYRPVEAEAERHERHIRALENRYVEDLHRTIDGLSADLRARAAPAPRPP